MTELRRTHKGRRTRTKSGLAVTDTAGDAIEAHFRQAGKRAKMRWCGRGASRGFVNEAYDVVTVRTIEESGNP